MEMESREVEVRPRKRVRCSLADTDVSIVPTNQGSPNAEMDMVCWLTSPSLCEVLGQDVTDDSFQALVAQKTSNYMVGRQEAETEVIIDRLIDRHGHKDKALLFVVSQIPTEVKVQVMVDTLLQHGANPSVTDSDWQTPLHHAARRGFKGVVNKLLENDALPHCRDRQHLMPLHIAITNNSDDIAALLLAFMPNATVRPLFLSNGDKTAELNLHDLINKNMQNFVYHDVVRLLIRRKWKEYARFRFQINSFLFILTQLSLCFCAVVSTMTPDPTVYEGPIHLTRAVLEVWLVISVAVTFLLELNQMRKHRVDYFTDQFNWIDLLSSVLLLTVVVLRWLHRQEQWPVYSVGFILWTLRIFKYAAVFRQTGAYAQILWRIVTHDFPQFIIVFAVILVTFSGSFILALRGENSLGKHSETSSFWDILFTGVRILIEGEPVVTYTGPDGYKPFSCLLMVIFLFTCCVVLLNILIAQLSDTYEHVQQDAQRGLELNRAWIISRVELNSVHIGKSYRQSQYQEIEEMQNPLEMLKKWEKAPITEMNKYVQDIWESLESHKLSLLSVKHRMSRQEYALCRIQDQMDKLLDLMTKAEAKTT